MPRLRTQLVLDPLEVAELRSGPGEAAVGADLDVEGKVRSGIREVPADLGERLAGLDNPMGGVPRIARGPHDAAGQLERTLAELGDPARRQLGGRGGGL